MENDSGGLRPSTEFLDAAGKLRSNLTRPEGEIFDKRDHSQCFCYCVIDDEQQFLLQSRGIACGWIGRWPEQSLAKLRELKASGKITAVEQIYLSWLGLFKELALTAKRE